MSSELLRVPQVAVEPLSKEQIVLFVHKHAAPDRAESIVSAFERDLKLYELYGIPLFLKELCTQVVATGFVPRGRAELFTGLVRRVLKRELEKPGNNILNEGDRLLKVADKKQILADTWGAGLFGLPERGTLILGLGQLASRMQEGELPTGGGQVRVDVDDACRMIENDDAAGILDAGVALSLLEEDLATDDIKFVHQYVQEYFAARVFARHPDPSRVQVAWEAEKVREPLGETIQGLALGDALPPLDPTGWEETTRMAAAMAVDPNRFIRDLIPANLPLAALSASSSEVDLDAKLRRDLQEALVERTQDANADLRARIEAGEALGLLGDPRFERIEGEWGVFLAPPLQAIQGGEYGGGHVDTFHIGQFPVTNAEFRCFVDDGGYANPEWWVPGSGDGREGRWASDAQVWREGRLDREAEKARRRAFRNETLVQASDRRLDWLLEQNWNRLQAERWLELCETPDEFGTWLDKTFASKVESQPGFWDETRFNNPAQPVVGVSWYEAYAYCRWLTDRMRRAGRLSRDQEVRLPTEAEFRAAAYGKEGREFPYEWDPRDEPAEFSSNVFETHLRTTAPVGVFPNRTPEGVFDLSGNVWCWRSRETEAYVELNISFTFQ